MNQCTHIILSATSSAGREVGKIVGSAHWLKQCGGTVAAMVAGGGENIITNISARGKRVMVINQQLHNGCFSPGPANLHSMAFSSTMYCCVVLLQKR